jgi:hypothetical protein
METAILEKEIKTKPSINDVKDTYKMTKEEFEAKCKRAEEQYEQGKFRMMPDNIDKYFEDLWNEKWGNTI